MLGANNCEKEVTLCQAASRRPGARTRLVSWIDEAVTAGARRWRACAEAELSLRTLQHWGGGGAVKTDARTITARPEPMNKLSALEQLRVLNVCNSVEYAQLQPTAESDCARLADQGVYLASESTFYQVLKAHDQGHRRAVHKRRAI